MNSCLYTCKIYHDRSRPSAHRFDYRTFMFCIDLSELGQLLKTPFISKDSHNIYSFKASDHLQFGGNTLRENLLIYLRNQGHDTEAVGRIRLLTNLRTFGYQFNPVSFYFIEDKTGQPAAVVAEVANTYNEQKLYYLGPEQETVEGVFKTEQSKNFYISPFSDPDTRLHFTVSFPKDSIALSINQSDAEGIYFKSGIVGNKEPISSLRLLGQTLRFPWITLQVMIAIHWHALILFLKKNPVRRKRDKLEQQTETRVYLKRSVPSEHQQQV